MASCPCGAYVAGNADIGALDDVDVALQDARRCLTRPEPSPSEAMIYIERAMELLKDATNQ